MEKYYLIEKWKEYEDRPYGGTYTRFDVIEFGTKGELEKAIMKGAKHGGELIAAQGLEIRVMLETTDPFEGRNRR